MTDVTQMTQPAIPHIVF